MRELAAHLDGVPVGTFAMTDAGAVSFTYDTTYRFRDGATPVSLSMPRSRGSWRSKQAMPFLAGLLPDSPERLDDLASRFRTTRNPFRLLEAIGRDAAGAVQLLPPDEQSSDATTRTGAVRRLSDAEVDALVRGLVDAPTTWGHDDFGGRWSLAGAQSKVALFRFHDGGWGIPEDSTPTTHILKPAVASLPEHDVNEYVSMAAARALGLRVADHELVRMPSGARVFVSARYDRREVDGRWRRLHQEDFCQALSVDPARKYQEQGGPSARQIAGVLRDAVVEPADRATAQRAFFDGLVFACASQNTDAHAKNFSVMLDGDHVALAPLYDLGSHAAYPVRDGGALLSAMAIGDEFRFSRIGEAQFRQMGRTLGIGADEATERYRSITGRVAAAYESAAAALDDPFASRLATAIAAHADHRGWTGDQPALPS